jgi:periplasmic divalent cation tolerance protein
MPDREAAQQLGTRLVGERLAACAQVVGPVASTYRWQGKIEQTQEWYCHLKTSNRRLAELQQRIRELHPYETPEIIAASISQGDQDYLNWVQQEVGEPPAGDVRTL